MNITADPEPLYSNDQAKKKTSKQTSDHCILGTPASEPQSPPCLLHAAELAKGILTPFLRLPGPVQRVTEELRELGESTSPKGPT